MKWKAAVKIKKGDWTVVDFVDYTNERAGPAEGYAWDGRYARGEEWAWWFVECEYEEED